MGGWVGGREGGRVSAGAACARQRVRARNLKGSNASHRNASHKERRKSAAETADDGKALQGRVSARDALDDAQPQHHGRGLEALSASSEAVQRVTRDFGVVSRGLSSEGEDYLHLISIYHYATAQEK